MPLVLAAEVMEAIEQPREVTQVRAARGIVSPSADRRRFCSRILNRALSGRQRL